MKDSILNPNVASKEFFLQLLEESIQIEKEEEHLEELLGRLKKHFIHPFQVKIAKAKADIVAWKNEELTAELYKQISEKQHYINELTNKIDGYKSYFMEPYFARMDVVNEQGEYGQYYIGKKGDSTLEIIDWRAPLARRYYQKSQIHFQINEYTYDLILRRAIRIQQGQFIDFKNEYLNVQNYLTKEEIAGRDEKITLDPFLKEILKERKNCPQLSDIIQTIQEKQYQLISLPEEENFIVQGCAGSGKTMVLLHRLSYLLHNNERLKPKDILVITPSSSFNSFIEELAKILQLEKVKTITLEQYFLKLLKNANIDIEEKIDRTIAVPQEYLQEIYSEAFFYQLQQNLQKLFVNIKENFIGNETALLFQEEQKALESVLKKYTQIKNANIRIRNAVMGELREQKNGGFWFSKDFRSVMNAVIVIEEFLRTDFSAEKYDRQITFYNFVLDFYQAGELLKSKGEQALREAIESIESLQVQVQKEILDLKRYKVKRGDTLVESYKDRIGKRIALLEECKAMAVILQEITKEVVDFIEIFEVLQDDITFKRIGSGKSNLKLVRFFYTKFIRPIKDRYKLPKNLLLPSDSYLLTLILTLLGKELIPRYSLVFVDEGQDISIGEYKLLKAINCYAAFNIYGDLKQNITPARGLKQWQVLEGMAIHELNQNYRNTAQIVDYVQTNLHIDMHPIALNGEPVKQIQLNSAKKFLEKNGGLKAIIVSEKQFAKYREKGYNILKKTERLSKTNINYLTVYESKGLEFNSVVVIKEGMSEHEQYIAYTRALKALAVV